VQDPFDPAVMTPQARMREVAEILAQGYLRHRALRVADANADRAAEEPSKKILFLPKSPVAAACVLARLSNKELIEAPRSEFVYVALLQRAGLERKYRLAGRVLPSLS
jgi:hypothetical protein